jgi:hypothetical protein
MGNIGFDPRFDERAKEQARLNDLTTQVEKDPSYEIPKIHLPDYEGSGFVSTMADRTAGGGRLVDINGVSLKRPVGLQAGQSYMFENPGQVWASGDVPVRAIMMQAAAAKALTGKDPLFFGHRMAPTGSDFATMTGETMLSYAESNMGRDTKKALNGRIKEFIPDWKGVDSPKSIDQFRSQPDAVRKAIHAMMDKDFRNEGGLGIGEARLSIADPEQLNAPVGYLMNVGKIFADQPLLQQSGHASYPRGVPGEGIGRVGDERSLFELYPKTFPEEGKEKVIRPLLLDPATALTEYNNLPNVVESRNIADPKTPSFNDTRALQMKPYYGILTEEILRKMGYAHGGVVHKAEGGMVDSVPEEAIKNTITDPQAFKMLDMDLANLALMNQQPRRMSGGGSVNMDEGGLLQKALRVFVPAQVRTFVGTLAGDESPITEKNFSGDELDQMRKAIMSSRQDRTAMNARLHHEAMQNAPTAKERRELFNRGPSKELDQTVGYQHYPGSPTDLISDFSLSSDAAIRNTLGRFAYEKTPEGNLVAKDLYKFRGDQSDKTRPTSDYADMGTAAKLWTLTKDTFGDAGLQTLPSRTGNAFLGNKPGRPVNVNLGKAPFAQGGAVHMAGGGSFNPQGADYDYQTARAHGMGQDGGNWGSVAPASKDERALHGLPEDSYLMLKGAQHPTWGKAVEAEESRGSRIVKHGDRYYSVPKMAGGGRPPLRSLDEVPSDEYLKDELARINAAPTVRANSADETANYARYVAERAGQPIEMPARPDYTPGFSVLEKPTYGSEVPGTTPTIDQQRFELTMKGQQDAANKRYRAQQGDALAGMDPTGTLAVTDAARTMGLGMLALPVHAGRTAFHYLQHGNMKDAPTGMDYEEFMSPRTAEGAELVEEIGTAGSRLTGSEMGFGLNPTLWAYAPPTVAQMRAGLKLGAERAAPVLGKVDKFVREGYDSGLIPQPGFSTKDVTPKALAPANEQGFYSPTEAAALNLKRQSGNGQAFLNDILKGENVRAEEVNAMGLNTFLKDKKSVTAAEVQDYIAKNKMQLGEGRYGALTKDISESRDAFKAYGQELAEKYNIPAGAIEANAGLKNIPVEEIAKYERLKNEWLDQQPRKAMFAQWQLPGGENYREVAINMPPNNSYKAVPVKGSEQWRVVDEKGNVVNSYWDEEAADLGAASYNRDASKYRSSHFAEPNILAHLRMSDRVTDGKKTLLVDEVQSDWHQAARDVRTAEINRLIENGMTKDEAQKAVPKDYGYETPIPIKPMSADELLEDHYYDLSVTQRNWLTDFINKWQKTDPDDDLKIDKLMDKYDDWVSKQTTRGISDAPYKEDWYQLALRRAIKEAVDGGYDRVALPTGDRVAERFKKIKHVDTLRHQKTDDGKYLVEATKDGNPIFNDEVPKEKLAELVGKEMAQKIINEEGQLAPKGSINKNMKTLAGLELKIGGEGMRKYYDEIYPTYLKKFGKKYGATVGKTTTPTEYARDAQGIPSRYPIEEPLFYMDITPAMRKEFSTGIHMKKGGKVSFASNIDAMRHELNKRQ